MMSSLYIGASGLRAHGDGMNVITNNLANVNTVGYKQVSMEYSDLISQYQTSGSNFVTNISQAGMGVMVGAMRTLFTDGGYESGSEATDVAINGIGFFGVQQNGVTEYTRAGDFRFNKEGELLDPSGWTVLGRAIVNGQEASSATPIVLPKGDGGTIMAAKATSWITACSQLGGLEDRTADAANPFFSLAAAYDGAQAPPLGAGRYGYGEAIQFMDAQGGLRSATIYYDKAAVNGGVMAAEYLIAMNAADDASALAGTSAAGLLMAGTLTFSTSGQLQNMTAFSPPASGDPADLSGWLPASLRDGLPAFTATTSAGAQTIGVNMGLSFSQGSSASAGLASAAEAAAAPTAIYAPNLNVTKAATISTAYGSSCSSLSFQRDGYDEGQLSRVEVNADGLITGYYTNGQSQDLYRISLYRFTSQDGLQREGGNHYSATPESGPASEGAARTENFGSVASYSLETSNVDYAREFSHMIITQRGFQMNSKVVTTSDELLRRALELKR